MTDGPACQAQLSNTNHSQYSSEQPKLTFKAYLKEMNILPSF